ncbi:thioredoxin domain-containing protein [Bacillus sp. Au-Bac7]|uniref:thioredoxin domain-containing protein n=1 Tax=Bacillus sp. Au-Bac7 TaxID=2906458 RepID=UPI001E314ADB|nr:thioredoxin domain-containing protein [Bacillus sp. Au-Bac7]MCE4050947.1 thioredoxin domain-containing protein [Bacillus sp. Au-Bac7]
MCLSFAVIFIPVELKKDQKRTIYDINRIRAEETFNQEEKEYIVYFWQKTCSSCKEIEQTVLEYREKYPLYIVDMENDKNKAAWYDWEQHHKEYDQVIGEVKNGKEIINGHVNMDEFLYDREVEWSIELTEDERIVAVHNTPLGNTKPIVSAEIEITGTPTMIKVKEGRTEEFSVGTIEALDLLK